jgi:hypothetical protein
MAREPEQRLMDELKRALDDMSGDLMRVELLAAAITGFSRPVPDYEPRFHHLGQLRLTAHELDQRQDR